MLRLGQIIINGRLSVSAGYYSAPIFFYNSKNLNVLGRSLFTTRRGVLEKYFFKSILLE